MYTDINDLDLWNQPDEGDPLEMLYRHREELSRKYPTTKELSDYYRQFRFQDAAQDSQNSQGTP